MVRIGFSVRFWLWFWFLSFSFSVCVRSFRFQFRSLRSVFLTNVFSESAYVPTVIVLPANPW